MWSIKLPIGKGYKSKNSSSAMPKSRLTFEVVGGHPAAVVERVSDSFVFGRRGNQGYYSFCAPRLGSEAISAAETAKARCVSGLVLSAGDPPSIHDAINMARKEIPLQDRALAESLACMVGHDVAGTGPISMLMESSNEIEEILVNSPSLPISLYHSRFGYCMTNLKFAGEHDFLYSINRLILDTGREIGPDSPIIDAQLENGSRLHAQLPPYSLNGAAASIRLSGAKSIGIKEMLTSGSLDPEILAYLWMALDSRLNIVISGAPSSGKTTLLNAITAFMPRYGRIVTIEEDVNEIRPGPQFINSVALQGRSGSNGSVKLKDQVINALHLRPDRLVIGELRGDEAREVFFGSNIGIPFMTTMHSSDGGMAIINRLQAKPMGVQAENLCMLDIGIFMKQEGLHPRSIQSIDEFMWLSRAELTETDSAASYESGLQMLRVLEEGHILGGALASSKVLHAYAQKNMKGIKHAVTELRKRAAYLALLVGYGKQADIVAYIESYGGAE